MTDLELVYFVSGFGVSLLLYWTKEAAYTLFNLFSLESEP